MKMCIENGQINGLDEVPYQGSRELLRVALSAPKNIDTHDQYCSVIFFEQKINTILTCARAGFVILYSHGANQNTTAQRT
jgi:hypothetical protein